MTSKFNTSLHNYYCNHLNGIPTHYTNTSWLIPQMGNVYLAR